MIKKSFPMDELQEDIVFCKKSLIETITKSTEILNIVTNQYKPGEKITAGVIENVGNLNNSMCICINTLTTCYEKLGKIYKQVIENEKESNTNDDNINKDEEIDDKNIIGDKSKLFKKNLFNVN